MYNGLSIYQTNYCKTTLIALPCPLFNHPIVGNSTLLHHKLQQTRVVVKKNDPKKPTQVFLKKST